MAGRAGSASHRWRLPVGRKRRAATPSIRHLCDAIEIAAAFDAQPGELDVPAAITRLQGVLQDGYVDGAVPDPYQPPRRGSRCAVTDWRSTMCWLSATPSRCLSARPVHRISAVEDITASDLCDWLNALPWRQRAGAAARPSTPLVRRSISTPAITRAAAVGRRFSVGSHCMLIAPRGCGGTRPRKKACCNRSTGSIG